MKYRIDITQTVTEGCTVFVEADCQEEAEDAALELAKGNTVEFRFIDTIDDMEIINVEEWPPEGIEVVSLDDPAAMHRAIARAVGEGE
jgi:hypothetical protein